MSTDDKLDQAAGKAKEVAGKAVGDRDLETEGRVQHGIARAKDAVKEAASTVVDEAKKVLGTKD